MMGDTMNGTRARRNFLNGAIAALMVLSVAACSMPTSSSKNSSASSVSSSGTVTLRIATTGSTAKTVSYATPTVAYYELLAGKTSSTQASLGTWSDLSNAIVALAIGTYYFTLDGYDSSGKPVLEGTLDEQTIAASSSLAFTLGALSSGTGTVSVTLKWPTAMKVASVTTSFAGSTVSPSLTIASDSSSSTSSVTYSNSSATSGNQRLIFTLKDSSSNAMASVTELVKVRKNLTSSASITLASADFGGAPTAPSGLAAANGSFTDSTKATKTARLTWTDNSFNETGFAVEYSDDDTTWTTLATLAAGTISYSDTTVPVGGTRYYRVHAANAFGVSAASAKASYYAEATESTTKGITAFSLGSVAGTISGTTITVVLPYSTDITAIAASFTTTGASVSVNGVTQTSGVTTNDFSSSLSYLVTAEDASTQTYTVTTSRVTRIADAIITAASSDLSLLVGGSTYTAGSGNTYTLVSSFPSVDNAACSSDGTKIWGGICGYPQVFYYSSDSGKTYATMGNPSAAFNNMAYAEGAKILYGARKCAQGSEYAGVFKSTDNGATWTVVDGSADYNCVATSSDGQTLVAGASHPQSAIGYLSTSKDGGVTWTTYSAPGKRYWTSVSSSSDGTKMVAVAMSGVNNSDASITAKGCVYTSTDSGSTWTQQTTFTDMCMWGSSMSSDGSVIAVTRFRGSDGAYSGGAVFLSKDGGATWAKQTAFASDGWFAVRLSSDGTRLVASSNGDVATAWITNK
jgi:hypothetical protein